MKITKTLTTLVLLCLMITISSGTSYANNANLKISVEPQKVEIGEYFDITLAFSTGQPIGVLDVDISYDNNLMTFHSGGGNVAQLANGAGGIRDMVDNDSTTKSYTFTFIAKAAGQANFKVTHSELTNANTGALLGTPTGNLTVAIGQKEVKDEEPTDPDPEPSDPDEEEAKANLSVFEQQLVVYKKMADTLPQNFDLITLSIDGQEVEAGKHVDSGVTIFLVEENGIETLYVYDTLLKTSYPYISLGIDQGITIHPIFVLFPDYTPTTLELDGIPVPVLRSDTDEELYVVSASNHTEGYASYYFYNSSDNSLVRASFSKVSEIAPEQSNLPMVLIAICIFLSATVVYMLYRFKRQN